MPTVQTDDLWLEFTHDIRNVQDDYWEGYGEWLAENEPERDLEAEYQEWKQYQEQFDDAA